MNYIPKNLESVETTKEAVDLHVKSEIIKAKIAELNKYKKKYEGQRDLLIRMHKSGGVESIYVDREKDLYYNSDMQPNNALNDLRPGLNIEQLELF